MRLQGKLSLVALAAAFGLVALGCSEPADPSLGQPPPPTRPGEARATRAYDYTHSIQQNRKSMLTRKFVVALIRFADDRSVDGVPYGVKQDDKADVGENATNVQVDVQVGGAAPPAGIRKQPLGMNRRAREILKHELMETESFVLVERERILDILREQSFGQTRYVNSDTSPELGEIMAVQYLLEGSIGPNEDRTFKETIEEPPSYKDGEPSLAERIFNPTKASLRRRLQELRRRRFKLAALRQMHRQNSVGVYLSLYDVRTSRIVAEAFGIGGNGLEAIRDAAEDLVDKCLDIPNPVRVAAIDGDRVYLDVGEEDHVTVGQRFRYLSPGPVVRNQAGQVIGNRDEEGGEIEIVRVQKLMSVARVTRKVAEPVAGARVEPLE